jgi:hypothetical protein
MASVRLLIDSFIIHLLLYTTAVSLPIGQIPILHQNFGHESVECTRVGVFTPNWFLRHTRPRYRQEIHGKALFYTKGASEYVKQLTCNSTDSDYVSLWQICESTHAFKRFSSALTHDWQGRNGYTTKEMSPKIRCGASTTIMK